MRHQMAVLEDMLSKNEPTEQNREVDTDSPYFEDSCRFSNLYHSLWELRMTLKKMVEYNEIIMKAEKKES